mgnify:CR=1 FL=1
MLYNVGYFGPQILFIIILAHLSNGHIRLFLIEVFNLMTNLILKKLIRQPRPKGSISVNQLDRLDEGQCGMPSSHAQLMGSMLVFSLLHFRTGLVSTIAFMLTSITLWQRYVCRKHTISQLAAGLLVGGALIFFFEFDKLGGCQSMEVLLRGNHLPNRDRPGDFF